MVLALQDWPACRQRLNGNRSALSPSSVGVIRRGKRALLYSAPLGQEPCYDVLCGGGCLSRIRASLRDQLTGCPMMGSGSGTEQSDSRPDRRCDRHKSHGELVPPIVPRGTSIRRQAELEIYSSATHEAWCWSDGDGSGLPRPAEFSAVDPHAMHDDRQPAGERDDRLLLSAPLAMFIAHAFSHDHFCTRVSMTCAAS